MKKTIMTRLVMKLLIVIGVLTSIGCFVMRANNMENDLILAIKNGDKEAVKNLLAAGVDPNIRDLLNDKTALVWAVEGRQDEITKELLQAGADINAKDKHWRRTALMQALAPGRTETQLKYAEDLKMEIANNKYTPLPENLDMVRLLLENGADVNAIDSAGKTPLMIAVGRGNVDAVRLLIEKGADVNRKDQERESALDKAKYKNYVDIVQLLTKAGGF